MKKLFVFPAIVPVTILLLFSYSPADKQYSRIVSLRNSEDCFASSIGFIKSTPFVTPSAPNAVMIRKNIYSLSAPEINSIKTGISAMKSLPVTNPTSWQYQAAIHGTTLTNNLPSWKTCQHGTLFFFSWHRMYLYFFERILRAKSGNPNLTLPYWNYQTNPVLHPDYRNSAAGNTLYDGSRNGSINTGGALGAGPMTAINNALNLIPYFDFQAGIEGPHGSIHGAIGGNMGAVSNAAKDPVFWLHHANIDRLWEAWLRKCGGRSNPTADNTWMNKSYTFFDETGKAIVMTGSQVVNTATSLNYRYDFPLMLPCNFTLDWWKWKWLRWQLLKMPTPIRINERIARMSFRTAKTDSLDNFLRNNNKNLRISATSASDKIILELQNVKINKAPEGSVEVYLNLSPTESPNPKSKSFAGVLDLFTATGHAEHIEQNTMLINATAAVNALGLRIPDLKNIQLTFYVRGNMLNAREINTGADIVVGNINIAMQQAQN